MKTILPILTAIALFMSPTLLAGEHNHAETEHEAEHQGHDSHEEGSAVKLNAAQVKQAGIETEVVRLSSQPKAVHAPGNVTFNSYQLADVTTLVDSVIHARHARLGDRVNKGQKLVTLSSSALAQSEADYLRAEAEYRKNRLELVRIKTLAKEKIVSQARLQQATSNHQAAHANLAAARATLASYGLPENAIDSLTRDKQYGRLTIRAPDSGTVVVDDFRIGQHIEAGTRLLQIADESTVWVEVKLSQSQVSGIDVGRPAAVTAKGHREAFKAKVVNIHHQLDPATRTVGVRLEVQNRNDALHPGMFVDAEIEAGRGEDALLLPSSAIQRQGNEMIVFVEEEPGHYERREVRLGEEGMGLVAVLDGLNQGDAVVVKGAFVLASELAKAGFEAHNH